MNRLLAMSSFLVFVAFQSLPADANEHGHGGYGQSAAASAQRSGPVHQPAPRQTFQQPPTPAYAQRSTGYAPAQSYQRPVQQPQGNVAFPAHPSVPQPMFRNTVSAAPTYRTAPALRSSAPTSWSARFAQNRDGRGGNQQHAVWSRFQHGGNVDGGGQVSWHQRFSHGSGNGDWRHNSGRNFNNNPSDGSSAPNYTVPILAVAAAITLDAFTANHSCSCDSGSTNVTINNDAPAPAPTPYSYHSNPAYYSHNGQPGDYTTAELAARGITVAPDGSNVVTQVAVADTPATLPADGDLPPDNPGSAVVHLSGNAPADEYFGSTHMSVLGIRNSINDTNQRAVGAGEEKGHNLLHNLLYTEQAFQDWQHQYPNDSWIIVNGYELVDDFAKLDAETPNETPHVAAIHGIDLGNWLDATYPGNQYASK